MTIYSVVACFSLSYGSEACVWGPLLLVYIDAAAVELGGQVPEPFSSPCILLQSLLAAKNSCSFFPVLDCIQFLNIHLFVYLFICVYICVGAVSSLTMACEWRSKGDCWESRLSFYHVGPSILVASTHAHTFHSTWVEIGEHLVEAGCLLPPCVSWELNSGHQD